MKKHCFTTIVLILILLSSSCSKKGKQENKNENIELHSVSYEHVVAPSGSYSTAQIFVKKSVPVMLGMKVDVIIEDSSPPKVIAQGAKIVGDVRWKVSAPFQKPEYPASGFITISLAQNQWELIKKAKVISVRPVDFKNDNEELKN